MIKSIKHYWLYILVEASVLLGINTVFSQQYPLVHYTVSDGLAQSEVNDVKQDSLGFLWIATQGGGVSHFDGKYFTTYNENNGIGGNIVTSIAIGDSNKVYFASSWGPVSYYDYKSRSIKQLNNDVESVHKIVYHPEKRILFGFRDVKIYSYAKNGEWKITKIPTDQNIINIFYYNDKEIIYHTKNEIFTLNTETFKSQLFHYSATEIITMNVAEHRIDIALKDKGIFELKKDTLVEVLLLNKKLGSKANISSLERDKTDRLWVATSNSGVYGYKNGEKEIIKLSKDNGLSANVITKVYCDKQNNIWIGTQGNGIFKFTDTPFLNYANVEGLNLNNIFPIIKDYKGRIWVGTAYSGAYVYDGKNVINFNNKNILKSNTVFAIAEDENHNIWLGTREGLIKYTEQGEAVLYTTENGLVDNRINTIMVDMQGRLWIGTLGGISILKNGEFNNFNENRGLTTNYIHTIFEDNEGIIWVGTGDGLLKYYDGNFRRYGVEDGLCNAYVGSIIEDKNGVLWLGTDRCISKFIDGQFYNYTEKDGLNSTIIYLMNTDNEGNIWVGTNKGLDKITIDENSEIKKVEFFGKEEGFYGVECNTRGTYKDKEGNLFFATIEGLFEYKANHKSKQFNKFPLYITDIKAYLKPIDSIYKKGKLNAFGIAEKLELPYDKNYLTIEFKGVNLKSAGQVEYTYKLEGFDSTWFMNTTSRYAVYSNLPTGDYTFRLKANSQHALSYPEEINCNITIKLPPPPFYLRWWFILLVALLIISLYYNFVFVKNRDLRISKEELEKKIKERTAEINKQNEEKTTLLQEIHHRVKNNLQVINSLFNIQMYYTDNEHVIKVFKESQNRILSMSKIHQMLYQSKDFSKLNLKGYITELINDIKNSYAVDNDIEVKLDIDEHIYLGMDSVVPFALIINEILSNALKYAFPDKNRLNTITVKITQDKDRVTSVHISDNGVGLPENFDWENPTSMGVDLIQTLVDQLDGTISLHSDKNGTAYTITFTAK